MENTIGKIFSKPTDYKMCKECGAINYYENDNCHSCDSDIFKENGDDIREYCESDYKFYEEEYGYSEDEVDTIEVIVR